MKEAYLIAICIGLSLPLASTAERCIVQNQMCDMHGDNLIWSQAGVTGLECKQLCMDERECNVFTYFGANSFPFHEFCMLFASCETLDECQDCFTAIVSANCTCGISYEGSIETDNIVHIEEDVQTEEDCRSLCSHNGPCTVYTYYGQAHATHAKLCMLLTAVHNPVQRCENCQTGPERCEALAECKVGVWNDGFELSVAKFLATETRTVNYISGESGCFKTVNAVAVGSGGKGGHCSNGGGGGSGLINATEFVLPPYTNMMVAINSSGTSLTIEDTGDIILTADNGMLNTEHCYNGGDGYSGGGAGGFRSDTGVDGGTDGQDGENGTGSMHGGKGSGLDISSISMKYFQLSAGNGGTNVGDYGGGGGGVLVDGSGPANGVNSGVGKGYGGGWNGGDPFGSQGCVILEL